MNLPASNFLQTKNEAIDAFGKLAKVIQNEKGLNIVSIRSDHRGEFQILKSFVNKMEFTIIFPPQEHLNKMALWKRKIEPLKKELELF